jgi:integrase
MKAKRQRGYVYEASGKFYIRYFETVHENGQEQRVHKSSYLCEKDEKHSHRKAQAVQLKADEFMAGINGQLAQDPRERISIVDFWKQIYLPFIEENLKPSTVDGYKKMWATHLKNHFAELLLTEYRTPMGSQFLTGLAKKRLGRRALAHLRSLASGIFSHAVNLGRIESNPWHDVKILGKVKAPANTAHYTLEQVENIISALVGHLDCQLMVALAFFLGLRPSEIAALQFGDFDAEWLHIRRAVWNGHVGETKTPESVGSVPLISPVKELFAAWRVERGNPDETEWVFGNGRPGDPTSISRYRIKPILKGKGIVWKGLYAGRRGAGTVLTQLTGDALAAQQILRHKNLAVTTTHYVKQIPVAGIKGMKLLEAAAGKK